MRDEPTRALKKLSIFLAEGVQLFTFGIEHSKNLSVLVRHRNNDLRTRRVKGGQIARIVVDVANDDRLARVERCPTQPLGDGKAGIRWWLVARFGENHEVALHDLVNANSTIIARRANHFHELRHPLWRAPAG